MFIYCICTQYLVEAPFALITASIRRGMEVISLWHCWGGMEAQVSSWQGKWETRDQKMQMSWRPLSKKPGLPYHLSSATNWSPPCHAELRFRSGEFAGQSSTLTPWSFNQLLVLLAVWAGAKSCWKMKSASLKSWSAEGSMKCFHNFFVNGCSDVGFQKTQWTNTSRWHCTPNHHRLWKLNTGLQATCAMSFSTLPPDSRTLVSKWNTKLALIWKEDFGPQGNSPVFLLLSPGKTPLMTTLAKFLDTSVRGGSWCLDLSPFLVKFTQILESISLDNPYKAAVLSVGCASFSSTLFPSTQLSVNMLGYSTLWTDSFFGNECLWLTLLVKGVNDCLLDNC